MYETFKKVIDEKGITPYRVAVETGISQATLSDWKLGKSKPKVDKLQIIADYLGVPLETFLRKTEDMA